MAQAVLELAVCAQVAAPPVATRGLSRVYPSRRGCFGVDLEVAPGEVLGLMGVNGSGKSTLLSMLTTAETPTSGEVRWFGQRARRGRALLRRLGVVGDAPVHFDELTGEQNIFFFARQYGVPADEARTRMDQLLAWSGLLESRDLPVAEYSLGMRRRLSIIEAVLHQPDLILMDEPTLGLDHLGAADLATRLRAEADRGAALVLSTNDAALAERTCDRVLFLHAGRVVSEERVGDAPLARLFRRATGTSLARAQA
ncbi:MAG TPA: ABC transporter ATP-binding protein [Candidatus Dormibacteraeota bacterium]|nr:ABC transporter ATP-binding protein [Candidatus Dormibacteraeota bacterium]